MSAFSADWLTLREPLDALSRSSRLSGALADRLNRNRPLERAVQVVDLGSGTGANLRYLAPWIRGAQDWLLVEGDQLLLDAANRRLESWLTSSGIHCRFHSLLCDLAMEMDQMVLPRGCLVTASALLDLVSKDWLRRLAERCERAAAIVHFALTYDGRMECIPADPDDEEVRALFNLHQKCDKGFGPALGPDAAVMAARTFEAQGYQMDSLSSDWHVGCAEQKLQHALVGGWFSAALEVDPECEQKLGKWIERRRALIDDGRSELIVGHVDMIGWPQS